MFEGTKNLAGEHVTYKYKQKQKPQEEENSISYFL